MATFQADLPSVGRNVARAGVSFQRFAFGVLAYTVAVVIWGAYVRASGSGAGCGDDWPLCNGQVFPGSAVLKTIVEFAHRASTGVDAAAVAGLCWWAFRAFPRRHAVRMASVLAVVFLIAEALLGAGLVLLKYTGTDASLGRAVYLSAHLANTQFLLASLAAAAWLAGSPVRSLDLASIPRLAKVALALALAVSITGAVAALGDTLFPATSLISGIRQDFSRASSFLLRLRIVHPVFAIASGIFIGAIALNAFQRTDLDRGARRLSFAIVFLAAVQLLAGAINVTLLAPVWMQLIHLLLANLLWIALVLFALSLSRHDRTVS